MSGMQLGDEPLNELPGTGSAPSRARFGANPPDVDLHAACVVALLALPGMGPARRSWWMGTA